MFKNDSGVLEERGEIGDKKQYDPRKLLDLKRIKMVQPSGSATLRRLPLAQDADCKPGSRQSTMCCCDEEQSRLHDDRRHAHPFFPVSGRNLICVAKKKTAQCPANLAIGCRRLSLKPGRGATLVLGSSDNCSHMIRAVRLRVTPPAAAPPDNAWASGLKNQSTPTYRLPTLRANIGIDVVRLGIPKSCELYRFSREQQN